MDMRTHCIHFPKPNELDAVGKGFGALAQNEAFRKCVGAIDGCHIRIKALAGPASSDYVNRKLFCSIQLQGVCDSGGKFWTPLVATQDQCMTPECSTVLYSQITCTLPQPISILTPYREPLQCRVQEHYNVHHVKACSIIERAFGMIETRWRSIFFKALEVDPTFVPAIITCCAALHNICLGVGDIEEPVQEALRDNVDQAPLAVEVSGAAIRNRLAGRISAPIHQLLDHDYL
ncbi:putative nuclease HARBI1 [Merluccius polli]|uniref:Nuclease HARBI1 n=1 Tax=Merluccius polli TaxID=89951 RepID=A0AA47N029_MERPO|nr:putative nuclease HARBI1 [Merluccius polli]